MYDLALADQSDRNAVVNGVVYSDGSGTTQFRYNNEDYLVENGKLYNSNHEVAVVYSPNFGGDWSIYSGYDPTDARVAILTLTGVRAKLTMVNWYGDEDEILFDNRKFWKYGESSRSDDLSIEWLAAGTLYKIDEYDGSESVVTNHDMKWNIA